MFFGVLKNKIEKAWAAELVLHRLMATPATSASGSNSIRSAGWVEQ
jgi:hypothetical protein